MLFAMEQKAITLRVFGCVQFLCQVGKVVLVGVICHGTGSYNTPCLWLRAVPLSGRYSGSGWCCLPWDRKL